jgi:hypothetical protein
MTNIKYKSSYTLPIILVSLNIVTASILLYKTSDSHIHEEILKYPFIDPARNFIDQSNYIVNIQPIREKLQKIASDFGNENISIYV